MNKLTKTISYIFLLFMGIIIIFPFIYMLLASLMTHSETISIPPTLLPKHLNWTNFVEVFNKAPFIRYFVNTVLVASIITLATLITSVFSAFALTSLEFRFKKLVKTIFLMLLMVPYESIIFTNYNTIAKLGLLNTYAALIIPFLTSIFYIYYLIGYFNSLPKTYYQAAKINGATNLEYIWKILVPMSKPALVTVGLLTFISSWNSFLWPLLVTNDQNHRLLNNGLTAFITESGSDVQLQLAAATLTIIPILIIYLIFRKQIIKGVAHNGIKG